MPSMPEWFRVWLIPRRMRDSNRERERMMRERREQRLRELERERIYV